VIISTSFGGWKYASICDSDTPAMTAAAANAVAAGITVFVSSGNDGYCDSVGWPACISHVVSIVAVYDAHFTSSAIGWCVSGQSCATKYQTDRCSTGWYSPEVPCAAGAAVCLQSASLALNGVFLTPAQVKSTLICTGAPITESKVGITKPRVNLGAAVDSLGICSYAIDPVNAAFNLCGGKRSMNVLEQPGCSWTAVSTDSWIRIMSGASGTGTGTVTYWVSFARAARTGTLTIAGQIFTVNQQ
jgi:subtilisin family serine protease